MHLSFKQPWLVIVGVVAVGVAAGWVSSKLPFRGDFIELLPENSDEVKDLRFVEQRAGGGGYLVVQVTGGDPANRQQFANELAPKLESLTQFVRYVEYRFDIGFFQSRALLLLPAERLDELRGDLAARIQYEKKKANPLFVDLLEDQTPPTFDAIEKKYASDAPKSEYVESQNGQELYLYVKPTGLAADLDFNRRLVQAAQGAVDTLQPRYPNLQVAFTGAFVIRVEEDETMKGDLSRASILAGLFAFGLILLSTRRPAALLVVLAPVAVGIAATFAFAYVAVGHLNPVTGFLAAILIGLGIEYGVHLSMRYWEEREHFGPEAAMENAVLGTVSGALTSALTNSAAFAVLVLADFAAFRQFGVIAGTGVMLTVLAAYLLGPSILAVSERVRPFVPKPKVDASATPEKSWRVPTPALIAVLSGVIVFAVFSVSVAKNLSFESDLRKLKGESPATDLDDHITAQLGIIMTPALIHVETMEQAREVTEIVAEVRAQKSAPGAVKKVASINDVVPSDLNRRLAAIEKLRGLVRDLPESLKEGDAGERVRRFIAALDAKPYTAAELPLEIRRRFSALQGGGTFVLLFPRYSGYDTAELKLWADDLDSIMKLAHQRGLPAHLLDANRLAARIFTLVQKDGPFILGAAAVAVFAMIWVSLKSLRRTLIVTGPLYLGMTCLFGAMWLTGVKLNFLNVVVLPNLLAIAVDNSVHLYHRYEEEGPGSLGHVVRHTGFAAVVATLSNAAGYGALLIAHHEGLRSIGVMALLGVTCTFIGTTIFFPALLMLLERSKRKASEATSQGADSAADKVA